MKRLSFLVSLVAISFLALCSQELRLKILDAHTVQNTQTNTREVVIPNNEAFTVELIVQDGDGSGEYVIDNSDHFVMESHQISQQITSINGRVSKKHIHIYSFFPEQSGSTLFGPARAADGTTSNALRVRVVPADEFAKKYSGESEVQKLSCSITSDKPRVYVGDTATISVSLRNTGNVSQRSLENITASSGATVTQLDQLPVQEAEDNGVLYEEVVQRYALTRDEPGVITINPVRATFTIPDARDPFSQMGGGFFGMPLGKMFNSGTRETVRSNPLTIEFLPLPDTDSSVDAIGDFSQFLLTVDKSDIAINEPVTVRVVLRGRGNFDAILPPNLRLPTSVTVYPSQTHSQGMRQRVFEYVLQMSQPGTVIIPEQVFHYFDTSKEQYETLRTQPVTVTVTGTAAAVRPIDNSTQEMQAESESTHGFITDIPYIATEGVVFPANQAIPLWLYLLLILGLIVIGFYHSIRRIIIMALWPNPNDFEYARLRKRLNDALDQQKAGKLYDIFRDVCTVRFLLKREQITSEYISHILIKEGWDAVHAQQIAQYMDLCAKAAFAPTSLSSDEQRELSENADYWFTLITIARGNS